MGFWPSSVIISIYFELQLCGNALKLEDFKVQGIVLHTPQRVSPSSGLGLQFVSVDASKLCGCMAVWLCCEGPRCFIDSTGATRQAVAGCFGVDCWAASASSARPDEVCRCNGKHALALNICSLSLMSLISLWISLGTRTRTLQVSSFDKFFELVCVARLPGYSDGYTFCVQ